MRIYRDRVHEATSDQLNERIRRRTKAAVEHYRRRPEQIPARLARLKREWDIERTLEANATTLILFTLGMVVAGRRRMILLPILVAGFLLQHALQGWCPPVPLFRRLGVRTQSEILYERELLEQIHREHTGEAEPRRSDSLTTAQI